uniref:Uncharacterized protein n=1 Tax=Ixodes ricinus TaxID=34613 RepID=A0A6B0UUE2_IXORI
MYLSCFFDILLILAVFLITCTISAFLAFSSRRLRFSSLRFFFSSISFRRASLISRSSDSSAFLSARCCCFTFHDVFKGLSWRMLENFFFSVFQKRPDLGIPLGTSKSSPTVSCFFLLLVMLIYSRESNELCRAAPITLR